MQLHSEAQLQLAHQLCFELHDAIVDYVVNGEEQGLASIELNLTPEQSNELEQFRDDIPRAWFVDNGLSTELIELDRRQLIFALLSDFCHFLFEGLNCSEKGKLTVALSLLRKPLQDNLFYLEHILVDWTGFQSLLGKSADDRDKLSKAVRRDIVSKAVSQVFPGVLEPEVFYESRFDKFSDIGLDPFFNQAIHLVTSHKRYTTAPGALNFIFSDEEDRMALWEHLYGSLPRILVHALGVVEALFDTLSWKAGLLDQLSRLRLSVGFELYGEEYFDEDEPVVDPASQEEDSLVKLLRDAPMRCPRCDLPAPWDTQNLKMFWFEGGIECRSCGIHIEIMEVKHRPFPPKPLR